MRKLIVLALLALALTGGIATVTTLAPQPALADGSDNGGGGR
jgi:hypothetical protein